MLPTLFFVILVSGANVTLEFRIGSDKILQLIDSQAADRFCQRT